MITWNLSSELEILKWFLGFQSFGKILGYSLRATLWKYYAGINLTSSETQGGASWHLERDVNVKQILQTFK